MSESTNKSIERIVVALLQQLRAKGFAIGVDTYTDALSITERFLRDTPNGNLNDLGKHLSPLLCRNREEQHDFDYLFSSLFKDLVTDEAAELQHNIDKLERTRTLTQRVRWPMMIIVVMLAVAIALIIIVNPGYLPEPELNVITGTHYLSNGDRFVKNLDALLKDPQDTSQVRIEQFLGEKTPVKYFNQSFTPQLGEHLLTTRLYSDRHGIDTTFVDTLLVSPRVDITILQSEATASANVPVTYNLVKNDSLDFPYSWFVSDHSGALLTNRPELHHIFRDTGVYVVSVRYKTPTDSFYARFPSEHFSTSITQRVAGNQMTITSTAAPLPQQLQYDVNSRWLTICTAMVCALIGYMAVLFGVNRLPKKKVNADKTTSPPTQPMDGKEPPYEITFKSSDGDIAENKLLRKISGNLIKTIETQIRKLDFKNSIRQTIRNAELITPVYKNRKQLHYYLMLLDEEYINSQQFRLFNYLAKYFIRNSVSIDVYSYNEFPDQIYKSGEIEAISLHELMSAYRDSTLIIFSSGHSLTEYKSRMVRPAYREIFSLWEKRILVTPVPFDDWSAQENVLSSLFEVVPADIVGLLEVIRLLQDQADKPNVQAKENFSTYSSAIVDFQRIESLAEYLDNDPELIQWLCALAVYPKIDWDVMIEIGKAVLGTNAHKINYTNLLKFARIRWMHEGRLTSTVRLELLKNLTVENELKSRATILQLMDEIKIDPSSFSYEEKMVNVYTNSFILFATSAANKSIYRPIYNKEAEIEANAKKYILLFREKKLLDVAFHQYVTKGNQNTNGEQWTTPIMVEGEGVDIDTFIRTPEKPPETSPKLPTQFYLVAFFILLLTLSIVALYGFKQQIAGSPINASLKFIHVTSTRPDAYIRIPGPCDELLGSLNGDSLKFAATRSADTLFSGDQKTAEQFTAEDLEGNLTMSFSLHGNTYSKDIEILPGYEYTIALEGPMCRHLRYDSIYIYASQDQLPTATSLNDTLQYFGAVRVWRVETAPNSNYIEYNGAINSAKAAAVQGAVSNLLGGKPDLRPVFDSTVIAGNNVRLWLKGETGYAPPVDDRQSVVVRYCPTMSRDIVLEFTRRLAGSFKVVSVQPQRNGACTAEVRYSDAKNMKAAYQLSDRAADFFGKRVQIKRDGYRGKPIIELFLNSSTPTILWVDDHPENNDMLVEYFRKYKIDVDFANSNFDALVKLNSKTYSLIITDVSRDKAERCVQDITSAGIELAGMVNFPKDLIFLYSASLNIDDAKIERASTIVPRKNIASSSAALMNLVIYAMTSPNDAMHRQNLNCEQECAPSSGAERLTLFYQRGTSRLNNESQKLLDQITNSSYANTDITINAFAYSGAGISNENRSQSNLREIASYFDKRGITVSSSSARGDAERLPDHDCDRVEILFAKHLVNYTYDTIRTYLGYKNRITDNLYEDTRLQQAGIELTLGKKPGREVVFNFTIHNEKCSLVEGSAVVRIGKRRVILSECGLVLTMDVTRISNGVAYFTAYLERNAKP